jgi:shikimate dehydrogenase
MKARYFVAGWPVAHSRSPAMHNAAFAEAGMEAEYGRLEVAPGAFAAAMAGLPERTRGLNVTHPHKEAAWAWSRARGEVSAAAEALRAVNTIALGEDGGVRADNTDASGFAAAVREAFSGLELRGVRALVLGGGGAARAVCWALAREGAQVAMAVRRMEQAKRAREAVPGLEEVAWGEAESAARESALVVNATPVGMKEGDESPLAAGAFRVGQAAMDLIYAPPETPFMRAAAAGGARTANGLPLLLHQAMRSWEFWMCRKAPEEAMRTALGM